ncbi:hypothetical protein ACIA5A_17405 [Micromonospora sp. NPDC051300]|uniref:hypothetical protein n=1 Tax=Micromonospora sp. NPDC051300 TaxID=3364286 RepID=UPI0037B16996
MTFISFSADEFGLPLFDVADQRYRALGAWLVTDISVYHSVCLDALAMIDDVAHGRTRDDEWDSDKYEVSFTPAGIEFDNEWVEGEHGRYPLDETREAVEAYWRFLAGRPENPDLIREYRPDLPRWQAELAQWEERWGRPHPYRGRLF